MSAIEPGTVIARVHGQLIWIKTDRGLTACLRVPPDIGATLDLGQRASVTFDDRGRAKAAAPIRP